MVRQAEEYGPEKGSKLESRFREQRLEEVRAANIILEEDPKEQRLELKLWRQNFAEVKETRLVKSKRSCSWRRLTSWRRWSWQPICKISPSWRRWSVHPCQD